MSNNIDASQWTLFDKIMYGGLGYSSFCLPTNFFKVVIAILFPPLGEIINILEDDITYTFPFITWDSIKKLLTFQSINTIVYSFLLTTLFYIPGLVYTLTNIVEKERKVNYDIQSQTIYKDTDELTSFKNKTKNSLEIGYSKTENILETGYNKTENIVDTGINEIGSLF
jgi:uncharacterized membrane protein YqaE (UPF0057 family)